MLILYVLGHLGPWFYCKHLINSDTVKNIIALMLINLDDQETGIWARGGVIGCVRVLTSIV